MEKPRILIVIMAITLGFLFSYLVAGCESTVKGFPQVAFVGEGPYKYEIQHEFGTVIGSGSVEPGQRVELPIPPFTGMYFFFVISDDGWIVGTPINYVGEPLSNE